MSWKTWAARALVLMEEKGVDDEGARKSLEEIRERGVEPYITLKAFVFRLEHGL